MSVIPEGWPCAHLAADPPSIVDRQSAPTADELLPQVLALTPRGAAWGTDGVGGGAVVAPVLRSFWRAIAGWVADVNGRDFEVASQVFPSAITLSLPDWELEYGLPDLCASGDRSTGARIAAVRGRFGAVGGSSPAYFVCLAKSIGYDVTIEEPTQFFCDLSDCSGPDIQELRFECSDDPSLGGRCDDTPLESYLVPTADQIGQGDQVAGGGPFDTYFRCDEGRCDDSPLEATSFDDPNGLLWKFWIVHVTSLGDTFFRVDEGRCDLDPLEGNLPAADLECLLRRDAPPHTKLLFSYDAL